MSDFVGLWKQLGEFTDRKWMGLNLTSLAETEKARLWAVPKTRDAANMVVLNG